MGRTMHSPGMVHLYIGDGKGKTSAAVGALVRAYGAGIPALFSQFLKGRPTGELVSLRALGIPCLRTEGVVKFIPQMTEAEKQVCRLQHARCFSEVQNAVCAGAYRFAVLDEVLDAVSTGMLEEQALLSLLQERPAGCELLLTGRDASGPVRAHAQYISYIEKIRHPYDDGIQARPGIEY